MKRTHPGGPRATRMESDGRQKRPKAKKANRVKKPENRTSWQPFTVADMAIFPWLRSWQNQGIDWADYPHLKVWFDRLEARPAVQRAVAVLADQRKPLTDDKARDILFGKTQFKSR